MKLYLDALEHNDSKIMEASLDIIINNFDEIVRDPDNKHIEFLNLLNFDNFVQILSSDSLNITHEKVLVDIVREYIKVRDSIKPDTKSFTTAQQATPPEVWAELTEEEKKTREDNFEKKMEAKKEKEMEELETEAKVYFEKEDQDKIQHVLDVFQAKQNEKIEAFA